MKKRVYFDHAATTPLDPRVFSVMEPLMKNHFGNPGSVHKEGVYAKERVEEARNKIASLLNSHSDEIIFTSGGTESNNLAIYGVVNAVADFRGINAEQRGKVHIITSVIEHASVLDVFRELEKGGVLVSYIPVHKNGIIKIDELKKALRPETILVSIMHVNNEIGTVQPISEIAKVIRNFRNRQDTTYPLFHTDASQSPAYLDMNVQKLGVDMLTLDAQKIYGPKSVGLLYKKRGVTLKPLFFGGKQEFTLRPGTENVPGVVGCAKALELATLGRKTEVKRLTKLRDYFIKKILESIPGAELNGDGKMRIANNVNFSFLGMDSDWIILQLDAAGIAVGSKSACLLGDGSGSYVISALGKSDAHAKSSVRFTLGKSTTKKDVGYVMQTLKKISN